MHNDSLGLLLLREGVLSTAQLLQAVRSRDGQPLAARLVSQGYATQADIDGAIARVKARSARPAAPAWKNGRPVRLAV